jgi:hypothetical protein
MQMVETHGNRNRVVGEGSSGGGGHNRKNENREVPPPPPPPYTAKTFFVQFLISQHNMEHMQQNMEAALCNIADNTRRGANLGGHEVSQYYSFKDFMDTKI